MRSSKALALVLLLAVLFRLWGVFHDLPFSYYGDELHFMKRSAALGTGDLNPHWFHKPAFLMYVLAFVDGLYYAAGRILGRFGSTAEFGAHFLTDQAPFLLLGRLVVLACGVATAFVVYRIARKVFGSVQAAFSAGFTAAVMAPMVASSLTIKSDVPCGLLISLSVLAFLGTRDEEERLRPLRSLVIASLLAGAAMGTHYYGIVLVPTYLALDLWQGIARRRSWRAILLRGTLVAALFLLGFFVTSPYNFLDPTWMRANVEQVMKTFHPARQQVTFEADNHKEFKPGAEAWGGAAVAFWQVVTSQHSMGLALTVLSLLGLVETLRRRETRWYGLLVLLPTAVFFLAAITVAAYHAQPRHLNAVYPLLATVIWPGGLLLARPLALLVPASRRRPALAAAVATVLAVLAALPSAAESARFNLEITRLDSRLVAYRWILQSLPRDARLLVDDYGPILQPDRAAVDRQRALLAALREGPFTEHQGTRLDLLHRFPPRDGRDIDELGHQWWLASEKSNEELRRNAADLDMGNPLVSRQPSPLADYRRQGIRYVVTNSEARQMYFDREHGKAATFPSFARFYGELDRLRPVKTFDPASWGGKGPVIWIYDLGGPEAR